MKNLFRTMAIVAIVIFASINLEAQVPQGINYQAVLRNASGQIMQNQTVTMEFIIHQSTATGDTAYEEMQVTATNNFGLVNLQIGQGTAIVGTFPSIQWGKNNYFLQVNANIGTGNVDMGTTQFITVPYAMVADTVLHAPNASGGDNWGSQTAATNATLSGNGTSGNPLGLAQQGASTGQTLKWNGTTWLPANDSIGNNFSGAYADLTGKPNLAIVATSGNYNDLSNLPTIPTSLPPNGTAAGDLSGTYPNPGVAKIQGVSVSNTTPTSGQVLSYNGTNWIPTTPSSNNGWSLTGNTGTNPATNFIGTTDSIPFNIKVNNQIVGRFDPAYSIFLGYQAGNSNIDGGNIGIGYQSFYSNTTGNGIGIGSGSLFSNTTGTDNIGIGPGSLRSNISGSFNIASGVDALTINSSGSYNISIGHFALFGNTLGNYNISIGYQSLQDNSTASQNIAIGTNALYTQSYEGGGSAFNTDNIAIGFNALYYNQPTSTTTSGNQNTGIGDYVLYKNTTGYNNTANGFQSLYSNTTGYRNTANGYSSLYSNTTGYDNIANGYYALWYNTSGNENTAYGNWALYSNTTGNNNTAIGSNAYANGTYSNSTAIGYLTAITANYQIRLGDNTVTSIGGYQNWTNISDKRVKKDIKETVPGLSFILKLRPVTYHLNMDAIAKLLHTPDSLRLKDAESIKGNMLQTGFIAQEVEEVAQECGFNFSGVDKPKNDTDLYGLRYAEFTVPLVKAVQEQQKTIEELQKQVAALQTQLEKLIENNKK